MLVFQQAIRQVIQEPVNIYTSTAKATEHVHFHDQIEATCWDVTEIEMFVPGGGGKKEQSKHDPQEEFNIISSTHEPLAMFILTLFPV